MTETSTEAMNHLSHAPTHTFPPLVKEQSLALPVDSILINVCAGVREEQPGGGGGGTVASLIRYI